MMETLLALKECLALILLTGLVTGYLYTLLKAREKYKPTVDALREEIQNDQNTQERIETEYRAMQEETEKAQAEQERLLGKIAELEANIDREKETAAALDTRNDEVREAYRTTHALLIAEQEKIADLKEQIGDKPLTDLLEEETHLQEAIHTLEAEIEQEQSKLEEIVERHVRVEAETEELKAHRDRQNELLQGLKDELQSKKEHLSKLEESLREKIAQYKSASADWLAKIKAYKAKLLQLKEGH